MYKSSIPISWRQNRSRYRLIGTKCLTCKTLYFPPRSMCPDCRRKSKIEEVPLSGEGEIFTYTIIYTAPVGFEEQLPYAIAIIKTKEGVLLTGQIVPPFDKLSIGKKVEMVFRKISEDGDSGIINYGFKFALKEE